MRISGLQRSEERFYKCAFVSSSSNGARREYNYSAPLVMKGFTKTNIVQEGSYYFVKTNLFAEYVLRCNIEVRVDETFEGGFLRKLPIDSQTDYISKLNKAHQGEVSSKLRKPSRVEYFDKRMSTHLYDVMCTDFGTYRCDINYSNRNNGKLREATTEIYLAPHDTRKRLRATSATGTIIADSDPETEQSGKVIEAQEIIFTCQGLFSIHDVGRISWRIDHTCFPELVSESDPRIGGKTERVEYANYPCVKTVEHTLKVVASKYDDFIEVTCCTVNASGSYEFPEKSFNLRNGRCITTGSIQIKNLTGTAMLASKLGGERTTSSPITFFVVVAGLISLALGIAISVACTEVAHGENKVSTNSEETTMEEMKRGMVVKFAV